MVCFICCVCIGVGIVLVIMVVFVFMVCFGVVDVLGFGDFDVDVVVVILVVDFGMFVDFEVVVKVEGLFNVIVFFCDWVNYGEIFDLFVEKYFEIMINEVLLDVLSVEEIQVVEMNKGFDIVLDVFDFGLMVVFQNIDIFVFYKVEMWDDIFDELKELIGFFVGDYGGYMLIGYDFLKFDVFVELFDLFLVDYKGVVVINGDLIQVGVVFVVVGFVIVQFDGMLDDFQLGIDFFFELQKVGNLFKVDVIIVIIVSGEMFVVFDWDYLNVLYMVDNKDWKVVVFDGIGYVGYYNQVINVDVLYLVVVCLWQEFFYSDEVQNLWLKGGVCLVCMEVMIEVGMIDVDFVVVFFEVLEEIVVLIEEQLMNVGMLFGEKWVVVVQ